jgi:enoyl-[acyl-carrier protein] reductase I
MIPSAPKLLEGKRGLIIGIANDHSIAWGCAKAFRALGSELSQGICGAAGGRA